MNLIDLITDPKSVLNLPIEVEPALDPKNLFELIAEAESVLDNPHCDPALELVETFESVAPPAAPIFNEQTFSFNEPPRLKDDVFTFRTYDEGDRCMRLMAMGYLHMPTDVNPEKRLHMVIGKVVETLLKRLRKNSLKSVEEGYAIVNAHINVLPPQDQAFAMERISELVARGLALDAQVPDAQGESEPKRARRFAEQFYAPVTVKTVRGMETFRLPAKPDQTEYVGYVPDSGIAPDKIVIIDDKTGGSVKRQAQEHLKWFGLVVSLWAKRKLKDGEWTLKPHQQPRRKRGYHLKRNRNQAPAIPIAYAVQLLGEQTGNDGKKVAATQPGETKYDRNLEESRLNHVKHVIKRVIEAFETNYFPAKAHSECRNCSYKTGCVAYIQWQIEHPEKPRRRTFKSAEATRSQRNRRYGRHDQRRNSGVAA